MEKSFSYSQFFAPILVAKKSSYGFNLTGTGAIFD
jgi:hypothetical protein